MTMKIDILTDKIIAKYNLRNIVHNVWVYIKIKQGMYGLKESGVLANKLLKEQLSTYGYYKCNYTPVLYKNFWRTIVFSLVVDDFGVKCEGIQQAKHLKESLDHHYEVAMYWKG